MRKEMNNRERYIDSVLSSFSLDEICWYLMKDFDLDDIEPTLSEYDTNDYYV